jgi:DNA-binding NarL/FixJ family response regulator
MIGAMPISVLLVDDDPAFRGVARRMLSAAGLNVVGEAGTVEDAAAAALDLKPEAALVDVGLPDGDGITLAGTLSNLPWRPRVLLTSTDPNAASATDVKASGASGFVPKEDLPDTPLLSFLVKP